VRSPIRPAGILERASRAALAQAIRGLPELTGSPLAITFEPELSAQGGKLRSGLPGGAAVHAGSFLRLRKVVLESALLKRPVELSRILTHEVFHFVWLHLGNGARRSFETLLAGEIRRGARGELGWSAEWRKLKLSPGDLAGRTPRWREYACESFCDTAACLFSKSRRSDEYTLAAAFRMRRFRWFEESLPRPTRV
jgi:hypothetical protein